MTVSRRRCTKVLCFVQSIVKGDLADPAKSAKLKGVRVIHPQQ